MYNHYCVSLYMFWNKILSDYSKTYMFNSRRCFIRKIDQFPVNFDMKGSIGSLFTEKNIVTVNSDSDRSLRGTWVAHICRVLKNDVHVLSVIHIVDKLVVTTSSQIVVQTIESDKLDFSADVTSIPSWNICKNFDSFFVLKISFFITSVMRMIRSLGFIF